MHGSLTDLKIEFDQSVSNYFPAKATVSFKAGHKIEKNQGKIWLELTDDFDLSSADVKVQPLIGFTSNKKQYVQSNSNRIEINALKAIDQGEEVKFTVSEIHMPRF